MIIVPLCIVVGSGSFHLQKSFAFILTNYTARGCVIKEMIYLLISVHKITRACSVISIKVFGFVKLNS